MLLMIFGLSHRFGRDQLTVARKLTTLPQFLPKEESR